MQRCKADAPPCTRKCPNTTTLWEDATNRTEQQANLALVLTLMLMLKLVPLLADQLLDYEALAYLQTVHWHQTLSRKCH